jgi:hypothetical protein
MLIDASVARSFAVIGWTGHLLSLVGATILVADGVHGQHPDDPSELRGIRRERNLLFAPVLADEADDDLCCAET